MPTLPEEIVCLIGEYLNVDYGCEGTNQFQQSRRNIRDERRALHNMCLVNRSWNRAATPSLYGTFDFAYVDLDLLVRGLATRPERAAHTKRIFLKLRAHTYMYVPGISDRFRRSISMTITDLGNLNVPLELRSILCGGLFRGDISAKAALILCLCHRLEYIFCLERFFSFESPALHAVFTTTHKAETIGPLSQLATLEVQHQSFSLAKILLYASRLPSLAALHLREDTGPINVQELPAGLSTSINQLTMDVSGSGNGLSPLLAAFPNLESCNLVLGSSGFIDSLGLRSMAPFLRRVGSNLRHIHIRSYGDGPSGGRSDFKESLDFLHSLETLSIPSFLLLPRVSDGDSDGYSMDDYKSGPYSANHLVEFLPASLKRLHVRCTKAETAINVFLHLRQIETLVLKCKCPDLGKVSLTGLKKRICLPTITEIGEALEGTIWTSFVEDSYKTFNWRLYKPSLPATELGFLNRYWY